MTLAFAKPHRPTWQAALTALTVILQLLAHPASAAEVTEDNESVTEIDWQALVAKGWNPQAKLDEFAKSNPTREDLYAEMERLSAFAPVEQSLDGKIVKLPGYVVPLEYNGTKVREFLLVPYRGACIHVPPPPPNQVVYSKAATAVEIDGMFAPVWVTGKMTTASVTSDLAEAAYTMDVYEVTPYDY